MSTNRLPKKGLVDSVIYLGNQLDRIQRELCCNSGGGGTGTVTSVGISGPSSMTITGSPITDSGTITLAFNGTTAQYIQGNGALATLNKAAVGLSNVDNTSDANKPVSTAQQTALNLKANLASPALTGTPTAPTATTGTNTTQIATTAFVNNSIPTVVVASTLPPDTSIYPDGTLFIIG